MSEQHQPNLSVGRNLKIGLFHLGSGMADVISTGIWNRIMISDLGFSATPIGLLVSLRYFLAPLGVWAGRMSDRHLIGGYRRLFWVWLGRAMMAVSIALLGLLTAHIARGNDATAVIWLGITLALLLFSLGNAFSGSTFLALIYDRAGTHQRGRAVGIVWTFLLLGFTVGGVLFGILLPSDGEPDAAHSLDFSPETLQNLFLIGALVMGSLWLFSVLGEERRVRMADNHPTDSAPSSSLKDDLALMWGNRRTRFFFFYLALSMIFAFSQDLILEPFAGDVFGMEARVTTRFAAYWGSMAILGTILFLWLGRRYPRLTNTRMSFIGVAVLLVTFALFALSSLAGVRGLVTPGLILLGIGLGIWNVGTLGMMMEMSPFGRAGTFLGFWTLVVTLSRGIGVTGGGILRDIGVAATSNFAVAYGAVFALGAVGLGLTLWTLSRVDVKAFQAETSVQTASTEQVFAAALD